MGFMARVLSPFAAAALRIATDTGVGKTLVSAAILRAAAAETSVLPTPVSVPVTKKLFFDIKSPLLGTVSFCQRS